MTMESKQQNSKLIKRLLLLVVAMFGFGFAMVPLYDVLCKVTGLNGKTSNVAAVVVDTSIDKDRTIKLQFVASVSRGMPWEFRPDVNELLIHPGQVYRTNFYAHNLSPTEIVGQAIPSIAPGQAAIYMNKTECFCFTQQILKANEKVEMPLVFFIDKDIPDEIKTLTLSYSMFNTSDLVTVSQKTTP